MKDIIYNSIAKNISIGLEFNANQILLIKDLMHFDFYFRVTGTCS